MRTEIKPKHESITVQSRGRGRMLAGLGAALIGGGLAGLTVSADRGQASPTEIVTAIDFGVVGSALLMAGCMKSSPSPRL